MARQIFVGLVTEGNTDRRFLESIVKKTFDEIAFECTGDIEVEISTIRIDKTKFVDDVLLASRVGVSNYGIMVLCVHADADADSDDSAFAHRINPAEMMVMNSEDDLCKNIVAVVPVRMTESWMLADKELLKKEIGTRMTDFDLGIHRGPETISDPKQVISEAIRIAREGLPKKRRGELTISDLYLPIGQKVSLGYLDNLSSYAKFKEAVREAFRRLNYLY